MLEASIRARTGDSAETIKLFENTFFFFSFFLFLFFFFFLFFFLFFFVFFFQMNRFFFQMNRTHNTTGMVLRAGCGI